MQGDVKSYSVFGPVQTADQFRQRQGGAPFQPFPPYCRGRAYGRRRDIARTLPKAPRPPRESPSQPPISGYAVIILNNLYNGDGPAESAAPGP